MGACPVPGHTGNALVLGSMVASDGSFVPFTIPPKKILVLSDVIATASGEAAGSPLTTEPERTVTPRGDAHLSGAR